MSDYVDSMDLSTFKKDDDGNPSEYITVEDTFSPVLHRISQVVRWRAIHPNDPIPPPYDALIKYSKVPEEMVEKVKDPLEKLIAACDIKKVELKAAGRKRGREQPAPKSGLDVESLLKSGGEAKKSKISASNAIPEFKRKLANTEELSGLESTAKEMLDLMKQLITGSLADTNYARVCEMLKVMREEYIDFDEPGVYNDTLRELKRAIYAEELDDDRMDMWGEIRINKLGLITKGESERGVDEDEAKKFLWG